MLRVTTCALFIRTWIKIQLHFMSKWCRNLRSWDCTCIYCASLEPLIQWESPHLLVTGLKSSRCDGFCLESAEVPSTTIYIISADLGCVSCVFFFKVSISQLYYLKTKGVITDSYHGRKYTTSRLGVILGCWTHCWHTKVSVELSYSIRRGRAAVNGRGYTRQCKEVRKM